MVKSLVIAASLLVAATASAAGGLGPYKIGMTREQVEAIKACGPYKRVESTGGLECPGMVVAGKKRLLSFVFDPDKGLKKIQVWFAESADQATAEAALDEVIAWFTKEHGPVESGSLPPGQPVTAKALIAAITSIAGSPPKAQLKPKKDPADKFVFASVFKDEKYGFYVFAYVQPPR